MEAPERIAEESLRHLEMTERNGSTRRTPRLLGVADCPSVQEVSPPAKVTIQSLPVELLDIIFKFVHAEWLMFTLHPERYPSQPNALRDRSWTGLMMLFCQFPYTPAAVCRMWRQTMVASPIFWTRPVVFVDGKNPLDSLHTLRAFIHRSGDLPLILAVVRKDYNVTHDLEEGMSVSLFLEVIFANLERFNDVYFHVHQSSSLPSISRFRYHQPAHPNLVRLAMHSDRDDGANCDISIPRFLAASHWPPALTNLKIDGRNFISMAKEPFTWSIVLSQLKSLAVERLDRHDEQLPLQGTLDLISKLPELEVLSFRDITFEPSARLPGTTPVPIDITDLILEDLDQDVVKHLFDQAMFNPTYLLMRNIPIDALPHVPQPVFLELVGIPIDHDIEDFLCFWDGEVLAIRECPGFSDSILSLFAEEISPPYHICPSLREIHIQDCTNFTGQGLRRMAEMRMDLASRRENKNFSLTHISDIYVSGSGPVLEKGDAEWLRMHMKSFVWSTTQSSGGSCHLDPHSSVPLTML
ncbi:hypothetical protein BKA70DRAFT_1433764 [Coprinopsis sp. MPI-PUGE-AT-0042]|nr:hypothetical protein BKA70DRAFT_1433764 [Coprinopsis sp. MPI-PUGE-AT-0042]